MHHFDPFTTSDDIHPDLVDEKPEENMGETNEKDQNKWHKCFFNDTEKRLTMPTYHWKLILFIENSCCFIHCVGNKPRKKK